MADRTKIEWADATWNPIRGCTRVSEGCRNCYAEVMAARFSDPGQWGHGLARRVTLADGSTDHRWTGKVELVETALDQPLRWRKPRRIFVNSTSDLFHKSVPDDWIDRVFAVMALAPQHRFLVPTKRPERAAAYLAANPGIRIRTEMPRIAGPLPVIEMDWPLPNVWLGTSVEDQATADARIPHLLATPAAVRFISAEPLLGPVDLEPYISSAWTTDDPEWPKLGNLDWVIVGGESGPGARPMHPDWARSLRDQCNAAGTAFFFKQWGEFVQAYHDVCPDGDMSRNRAVWLSWDGEQAKPNSRGLDRPIAVIRIGKRAAGRLLDGREWNEVPG